MNADACDTVGMTAQHKLICCISFQNKEKKNPVHFFFLPKASVQNCSFF